MPSGGNNRGLTVVVTFELVEPGNKTDESPAGPDCGLVKGGEQQAKTRFTRVGESGGMGDGEGRMGLNCRLCFCASSVLWPDLVTRG